MTPRTSLLFLLAGAACASAPVPPAPPANQAPLPRSSIVAVLAHRGELELGDEQAAALEQADAELQQVFDRLRTEGAAPTQAGGGLRGSLHGGPPQPSDPGAGGVGPPAGAPGAGPPGAGGPGGGRPGGFGMNTGPGGFQVSPTGGMSGGATPGGGGHGGVPPSGAAPAGAPRRDPRREQQALEARLDDADTRAFLKVEPSLTPAQRERAREIAGGYREQLFERREQQRGR